MKRYIHYILSVYILSGLLVSCDDMFDVDSQSILQEEDVFSIPTLAEGAIAGIIHSFGEQNSYRGRIIQFYGSNTDIEWYNTSEKTTDDRAQLTGYMVYPTNARINTSIGTDPYSKLYESIERANICIDGFQTYGDIENNEEIAQLYGEALTLRAMVYHDLIKMWGDVPARFEKITNETLYKERSDRDVIYKQLIADLETAAKYVKWPNETTRTSSVENINKAFVKGLRARICLAAAGHAQRWNGEIRLSNDPDLTKEKLYPIVIKECLDIINEDKCSLDDFETIFKDLCGDVISAGRESLWEIPFAEGRGQVIYSHGIKHSSADKYVGTDQGGAMGPVPHFFYDYDPDDVRRDITCIPYLWTNGIQVPNKLSQWYFGKYRYEWMNRRVVASDDGVNWPVMRYADIYLMAAEAINVVEGPAKAAPYLRKIRERAFPNNPEKVEAYMTAVTTDEDTFFKAIVDERAFEFCGEFLRKGDLIRWNLLKTKMDEAKEKMFRLRDREGEYADYNDKIYYKYDSEDAETVKIYGLEKGETEDGKTLGYTADKNWLRDTQLADDKINSIYQRDPDKYQYWPIIQSVIDGSNNKLSNQIDYYAN